MGWFKRADGSLVPTSEEGLGDVEFKPKEFEDKITKTLEERLTASETKFTESMKPMQEMAELMRAERAERVAIEARKAAAAKKEAEGDFSERMLVEPEAAIDDKLRGTNNAIRILAARESKRETLSDKEYYHGAVKDKTDAYIEGLPLQQRGDPASIINCYHLACWDNQKEINEGKIKSRNTSGIFEGGSTGAPSGSTSGDSNTVLSEEEKKAAKVFGISEKDWGASKKELTYV